MDLEDALATYFKAYENYQIDEILDWFLLPCHLVSDADEVMLLPQPTREACRIGVEKVLNWHRELGVAGRRIAKQIIIELSPRISCVDVKVDIENRSGLKLYDFEGVYTFVRSGPTWRIAAITHNQIPRLLSSVHARRREATRSGEIPGSS